jgi:hypothetical protein
LVHLRVCLDLTRRRQVLGGLSGDAPLPDVPAEVRAIRPLLPKPLILTEPSGTKQARPGTFPTRANVLRYLPQYVIGHFACHGASLGRARAQIVPVPLPPGRSE